MKAVKILFRALRSRGYSRFFLRNVLRLYRTSNSNPVMNVQFRNKIITLVAFYSTQSTQLNGALKQNFYIVLDGT